MNLRILLYSNPLVVDKVSKEFQYWKDSGFLHLKQLISGLPAGWRFYWCIPGRIPLEDRAWFREANRNVELVDYPYSSSIHQNRYNFSMTTLSQRFTYAYDIDAVLCNQPEVSANLKVWFLNQRREHPLIFSFYHWIDCPQSRAFSEELGGYDIRQGEGAMNSDYIVFHNPYAYWLFRYQFDSVFATSRLPCPPENVMFLSPGACAFPDTPFVTGVPEGKKIILFNHRLNNTTRWQEVIDILDEVWKERQDFVLWLTDDGKLKEFEWLRSREYIVVRSLQDGQYGHILRQAHFSVCNHQGYSTWNMAVVDSFVNGCLALIPNREVYQDMFQNSLRAVGDQISHSGNLHQRICEALDRTQAENQSLAKIVTELDPDTFSGGQDSQKIQQKIEERIAAKGSGNPKGYEDVRDFILEHKRVPKTAWVNQFWSFHVNSNFPAIRAKLLLDGRFEDQGGSPETIYTLSNDNAGINTGINGSQPGLFS